MKLQKIDIAKIAKLAELNSEDGPDFAISLIEIFLKTSIEDEQRLLFDLTSSKMSGVRRSVHKVKSVAYQFGAIDLYNQCRRIEERCEKGDTLGEISSDINEFRAELDLVRRDLRSIVEGKRVN